jgi:hypothetical protein
MHSWMENNWLIMHVLSDCLMCCAFCARSEEVPRCSRQLPSWREKWVPMVMQQLAQLQQQLC